MGGNNMKAKKKTHRPPYRSVKKLQTYFIDTLLDSEDCYPLGDYVELGPDGIYRTQTK